MAYKIPIDEERELVKKYLENEKMTVSRLAAETGRDRCTLSRLLQRNGVKLRRTHQLSLKEKIEIIDQCSNEIRASIPAIAAEYNVDPSTIHKILKRAECYMQKDGILRDKSEKILEEYFENDVTQKEIADRYGYTRASVTKIISEAKKSHPKYKGKKKSFSERKVHYKRELPVPPEVLIEEKRRTGLSYTKLAKKYNVSESCIYHVFARARGKRD